MVRSRSSSQHAILHDAGYGDDDGENAPGREPRKVDMLQGLQFLRGGQRHAQSAGDQGQHMRGALEKLLAGADAGEAVFDLLAALRRQRRDRADPLSCST